ncbi:MAG: hypothetical protein O7B25_13795 [Gammaproteobacteria bacterium]|nr:hypothetical protein [Gammaproteobacteria bacterium]
MIRRWGFLLVLYGVFFSWYTSFGGPLGDDEIDGYIDALRVAGADENRLEVWRVFMESDSGDDFAMLNAIELRDVPLPTDGAEPGENSADVLARYTQPFLGSALLNAAHPVMFGAAAAPAIDTWGIPGAETWTSGALIRYRSRRDLMEQALHASGLDIHRFKVAAMEKTLAYPLDPWWHLGDPRLLLGLAVLIVGLILQVRAAGPRETQPTV